MFGFYGFTAVTDDAGSVAFLRVSFPGETVTDTGQVDIHVLKGKSICGIDVSFCPDGALAAGAYDFLLGTLKNTSSYPAIFASG